MVIESDEDEPSSNEEGNQSEASSSSNNQKEETLEKKEAEENCLKLSTVSPDFKFDPKTHKRKVIGVYTEKGGVGKTNFILSIIASGAFKRVLIIDTDPQNNVINGFTPSELAVLFKDNYLNCEDFLQTPVPQKKPFTTVTSENTHVTLVMGTKGDDSVFEQEFKAEKNYLNVKNTVENIRSKILESSSEEPYDVVFIDFNPKFCALTKTLLIACDEVVTLLTGDTHSNQSLSNLISARKQLLVTLDDMKKKGVYSPAEPGATGAAAIPQPFHITAVPSKIERRKSYHNNLGVRVQHGGLVDKIFCKVKEIGIDNTKTRYLWFRGYVGLSHKLYGEAVVRLFENDSLKRSVDMNRMIEDVVRIVRHCILGTQEHMKEFSAPFPWKACTDLKNSRDLAEKYNPQYLRTKKRRTARQCGALIVCQNGLNSKEYLLCLNYKSIDKDMEWNYIKSFHSTDAICSLLQQKLLQYFSNKKRLGHKSTKLIVLDQLDDGRNVDDHSRDGMFLECLNCLEDIDFARDFITNR